jgi:hypothetical protein
MNGSGNCSSVESSDSLGRVEAADDLGGVSEGASLSALVLDNNSCHLKWVWKEDTTESVAQSDHIVIVSEQCRNQSCSDQEVSANWWQEAESEDAGNTNLREDLAVGLCLAIVIDLLVYLKNI